VADTPFAWEDLARHKAEGRFLDGYPDDQRTFFAPRDDMHGLLVALLGSAQHSIVVKGKRCHRCPPRWRQHRS
jgi:hypothetical protein